MLLEFLDVEIENVIVLLNVICVGELLYYIVNDFVIISCDVESDEESFVLGSDLSEDEDYFCISLRYKI